VRISSISLKNFKRFTDLTIQDIPETAKLVVVVGPNGSGKSSLFDAFNSWYRIKSEFGMGQEDSYFRKDSNEDFNFAKNVKISFSDCAAPARGCMYLRSAYRHDPDFNVTSIDRRNAPQDDPRFSRIIETDATVADNFKRLVYDTMSGVYDSKNDLKSVAKLRDELIGGLQKSLKNVFGSLTLDSVSDPLGSGAFYFGKGAAQHYHYKNLSGGEKAVFDLLLDMHIKKQYFKDTVYCLDEIETHLHTRVQGALLKELVSLLPGQSSLWVTTHSLGVLRAAQDISEAEPGSACLIDFDVPNPDEATQLLPSNLDRISWEKFLSVALDDLSPRVAPKVIVVCEGSSTGRRRRDFDAEIYNRILGSQTHGVIFVSGGNSDEVLATGKTIKSTLAAMLPATKIVSLCDGDDKTEDEVRNFEANGNIVLPVRNLECYLLEDEVIIALLEREGKRSLEGDALEIKETVLSTSVKPSDDLKSAAGHIFVGIKKLLDLKKGGSNSDAFMRDTLAPLITPTTKTYQDMKSAILDRL
jgi:predicted ATPase